MGYDKDTNLLTETTEAIGELLPDVRFVMCGEYSCTWDQFAEWAKDINYDDGYGLEEIPESLKVVGSDWWIERHGYDGSEWWEFKQLPNRPEVTKPFKLEGREYDTWGQFKVVPV